MPIRFYRVAMVLICLVLSLPALSRAGESTTMSREATEEALENIFARLRDLRYAEMEIQTISVGGIMRKEKITYGTVRFLAPHYLQYTTRGESAEPIPFEEQSFTLLDGTYFWQMDPIRNGTRKATRRKADQAGDSAQGIDIASFFIGRNVKAASELWDTFDITATRTETPNGPLQIFNMQRKDDSGEAYTLYYGEGDSLPRRVIHLRTKVNPVTQKKKVVSTERRLSSVKSNLDGLEPFPAETFLFPMSPHVDVRTPTEEQIDPAEIKKELEIMRQTLDKRVVEQK